MSFFDDIQADAPGKSGDSQESNSGTSEPPAGEPVSPLAGDPISYVGVHPEAAHRPASNLPEDLRISWSWPHLLLFVGFALVSQLVVGVAILSYYSAHHHLSQRQFRRLFESDPKLIVGTNVLWFAQIGRAHV